jgi:hypothetical protein
MDKVPWVGNGWVQLPWVGNGWVQLPWVGNGSGMGTIVKPNVGLWCTPSRKEET